MNFVDNFILFSCVSFILNSPPLNIIYSRQKRIKINFSKPSIFFFHVSFLFNNFSSRFLPLRTYGGKPSVNVFVYTNSGNSFQFSSIIESSKVLRFSPNTIRSAANAKQPEARRALRQPLLKKLNHIKVIFSLIPL
jgi:hypothetical protein